MGSHLIEWRELMENATFRKWLIEQGCRFDTQHEERGEGHGTVTIHREGRSGPIFPDRRAASEVSERHPEMPALFKRAHYQLGYVDMSVPVPARIYGVLWCEQCLYC